MMKEKKPKKTRNWVGMLFFWFFRLFPIKKNRIYFISRYGQQFSCNPRALFEYIYKNHHDEFEFVYCLNKPNENLPADVKRTKFMSLRDMYYLHTSKYVVNNLRFPLLYSKRKKQVYVQTWHNGPIQIKKIEKDVPNMKFFDVWNSKVDGEQIDLLIVGSKQAQQALDGCFYCDHKTILSGNPRCDQLVNKDPEKIDRILKDLNLSKDDFIVLYAPTFRENQPFEDLLLDDEKLKKAFEKGTGKNVKILYRFHPYVLKNAQKEMQFEDYVLNVTNYPEMQELLLISDVLITDFSSCMFDMMVADKPSIIYSNDMERYTKNERGLYFPLKLIPCPIAQNMDELAKIAENLNADLADYKSKIKKFLDDFGCVEDGHSCERLFDAMINLKKE